MNTPTTDFAELADSMLEAMRGYCDERVAQTREQPCSLCNQVREQYEALHALYLELEQRVATIPAGPPGERGDPGEKGERGLPGQDGRDGRDGIDGAPGRDALQVQALRSIDPERRYARGTWAHFEGGLVSAFRSTDPLGEAGELEKAGWQVEVAGLNLFAVEHTKWRTLTVKTARTNERAQEIELEVPGLEHRGVWKQQREYKRGDCVTWVNSLWACTAERTSAEPGLSPDWIMSARKGENGKDGRQGAPGERGPAGPAGRDYSNITRTLGAPT